VHFPWVGDCQSVVVSILDFLLDSELEDRLPFENTP
jgi:hypothetical protein